MPVTAAPEAARRDVYSPGPQPKSATALPSARPKRETIQATDRSMNSVLREETSIEPSRWKASILDDVCSSVHRSAAV